MNKQNKNRLIETKNKLMVGVCVEGWVKRMKGNRVNNSVLTAQ